MQHQLTIIIDRKRKKEIYIMNWDFISVRNGRFNHSAYLATNCVPLYSLSKTAVT